MYRLLKMKHMDQLELTFTVIAIIAGGFLAWLYTKSGKKWLANL